MSKKSPLLLKRSLLSCAVLMAAGGMAPPVFAVDLCTESSTTINTLSPDDSCSLDADGDRLTVGEGGVLGEGLYSGYGGLTITNAGVIADDDTAIYINTTMDGTLRNSGLISVNTSDSSAVGIYINGELSGSLLNSGSILAKSEDSSSATVTGIYINGDLSGDLSNSGTISAVAHATSYTATAYGIYVDGDINGSLTNSGTINVEAMATGDSYYAYAYGGYVNGGLYEEASLVNSGTINVTASSNDSNASAYGLYLSGAVTDDARLVNSGTINVTVQSRSSTVYAYGLYVDDGVSYGGLVENRGTISVSALSGESDASAYGIYLNSSLEDDAQVLNSGTINIKSASLDSSAYGYGIYVSGSMTGNAVLANRGTINVEAMASDSSATAYGIYVTSVVTDDAQLVNRGTINVKARSDNYYAYAYGMYLNSTVDYGGLIENQGTITAEASGVASSVEAYGIYVGGGLNGDAQVINSGTIVARAATTGQSSASAYGMSVYSINDNARLINSGDILAIGEGQFSYGYAYGIDLSTLSGAGSLVNEGSITARASATHESAYAYGISASSLTGTSSVINDGTITVSAVSGQSYVSAYGMDFNSMAAGTSITNNGTIDVSAVTAALNTYGSAYGIYVGDMNGTITNEGVIKTLADGTERYEYGIYANSGSGSVINNGTIEGTMYLGGTISLTNAGSIRLADTDGSYVGGTYTQEAGGSLEFVLGDDTASLGVGGVADFTDSNEIVLSTNGEARLEDGDVLSDLISAGTLTAPDGFQVADASAFWNFEAVVDGNTLDVTISQVPVQQALGSYDLSPTLAALVESALAGDLDSTFPELAAALSGAANSAEAVAALGQISPALAGGAAQATRVANEGALDVVDVRMGETGASSGDTFSNTGVWIKPFLGMSEQDDVNGISGYDVDTSGFVIGLDGDASENVRVGLAVGSSTSEASGGGNDLDIDSLQLIGYGTWSLDKTTALNVKLGFGNNSYDSVRRVALNGEVAAASFDGTQLAIGADLSRSYQVNEKTRFVPSVGVQLVQVDVDGYDEKGAGVFNLSVGDSDAESTLVVLNGAFERTLSKNSAFLANLGLAFDTTADATSVSSRLAGGSGTYVVNGIEPEDTTISGGLGYRYLTAKDVSISANYDLETRSDFIGHTLSVKFQMPF